MPRPIKPLREERKTKLMQKIGAGIVRGFSQNYLIEGGQLLCMLG
jgi:hypothetical protein